VRDDGESAHGPPEQGLYLDESEHVWVDGHQLEQSLSDLEFRLLKTLYRVAPDIVSQEELIAALWHDGSLDQDNAIYARDEKNVRTHIACLRKRLEPAATSGVWRFVRNARGRGYWLARL
jgi:DNA-binding response OmpR family regulator